MQTIDLAKDFSPYPGGRFKRNGPFSGEEFRERILVPALRRASAAHDHVLVTLSEPLAGLPGPFADEAFGSLITRHQYKADGRYRSWTAKLASRGEIPIVAPLAYVPPPRFRALAPRLNVRVFTHGSRRKPCRLCMTLFDYPYCRDG